MDFSCIEFKGVWVFNVLIPPLLKTDDVGNIKAYFKGAALKSSLPTVAIKKDDTIDMGYSSIKQYYHYYITSKSYVDLSALMVDRMQNNHCMRKGLMVDKRAVTCLKKKKKNEI